MNFDELLNYCNKLNESKYEKCLVCHVPIEPNDIHLKFKCSHYYHPDCIVTKTNHKWDNKQSYMCMYCEKKSIPTLINNIVNDNLINNVTNNVLQENNNSCKIIMKSGSKKGQACGRINCKYHNNIIVDDNLCTGIIKSGTKKGQICNRTIPCSYHKVTITEIIV